MISPAQETLESSALTSFSTGIQVSAGMDFCYCCQSNKMKMKRVIFFFYTGGPVSWIHFPVPTPGTSMQEDLFLLIEYFCAYKQPIRINQYTQYLNVIWPMVSFFKESQTQSGTGRATKSDEFS